MSKKIFINPNNTFTENVSKFWLAFTNYIKNGEFFDCVPEEYKTIKGMDLNETWRSTYIEYLGNKVVCHTLPVRPGRNLAVKSFTERMLTNMILQNGKKSKNLSV